ncbi:MAG: glycosyltransferase family 2 protein, partial [Turicibacter sp.]|nr:glycosyltransferase family 2 protein [Turicibacter sp.]
MGKIKYSVIVSIYNVENFIDTCIKSIINQTYDNLEIILIDDGSQDNCGRICDEYAKKDSRIVVVHKENGGLVSARKAGAKVCTGDYVLSIDGDDWVDLDLFQKVNNIVQEYFPDIVNFGANYYYSQNKSVEYKVNSEKGFYDKKKMRKLIYPYLIENENGQSFLHSIWSKVIKKDLYVTEQLKLSDELKIGEDTAITKTIISKASSMYNMEECLYYYRQNDLSMTKVKKPFNIYGAKLVGIHLEQQLETPELFDKQIARYVVHNLFIASVSQYYDLSATPKD